MKLLCPAHIKEAELMAQSLMNALHLMGVSSNCRDPYAPPVDEERAKKLLAKSMGYEKGWGELALILRSPHEPVYLDGNSPDGNRLLEQLILRMSENLGFDYAHGVVINAIQLAGVGHTTKTRRSFEGKYSPWGLVTDEEVIAEGILSVTTGSHGGIVLSNDRQSEVPLHLRLADLYYEEDCYWALVALAFPEYFKESLKSALASVRVYRFSSVPNTREPADSRWEKLMAECYVGYIPPDQDPMNREATPEEEDTINYLAECVYKNRVPISQPAEEDPTLQDWVKTLSKAIKVDGKWPMLNKPWKEHWVSSF